MKPSDVYIVGEADILFYHGYEPWVKRVVEASGSKAVLVKIGPPLKWHTPEGASEYYKRVAEALEQHLGIDVSANLNERLKVLEETFKAIKAKAEELHVSEYNVICMKWQVSFVKWLGFNVVAEYPPPEKLSPKDLEKLVEIGKKENVSIVIDNLQSGIEFGKTLSEKIGAVHVVLSSFPGTEKDVENVPALIERNAEKLFSAVKECRLKIELLKAKSEIELYQTLSYSLIAVVVVEAVMLGYSLRRFRKGS